MICLFDDLLWKQEIGCSMWFKQLEELKSSLSPYVDYYLHSGMSKSSFNYCPCQSLEFIRTVAEILHLLAVPMALKLWV